MFYFTLARELKKTVRELLSSMDSREITEWQAYFRIMNEEKENKPKSEELSEMIKAQLAIKKG